MQFEEFVRYCAENYQVASFRRDGAIMAAYVRNEKLRMVYTGSFLIPGNLTDLWQKVLGWACEYTPVRFDLANNDSSMIVTEYAYTADLPMDEQSEGFFRVFDLFHGVTVDSSTFGAWEGHSIEFVEGDRMM